MKKTMVLCAGLFLFSPHLAAAQTPRDTPPPAIENARRERELRALVASGSATKETYLELAQLANLGDRPADAIAALRGAAALEPDSAEAQHRLATFDWEYAQRGTGLTAATKLAYVRDGLAAEDRAIALRPDYPEALTYKSILLRMEANLSVDPVEQTRLISEADALRSRVMDLQRQQGASRVGPAPPPAPAASFAGFAEPFEQAVARLQPVRVGGNVRQPTKIRDVKPVYPAVAQDARVQGVVIIEAIIDESGAVANARVLRSIPLLDEAALDAVSRWQFTPTEVNSRPAAVVMTVTVNFTLQ